MPTVSRLSNYCLVTDAGSDAGSTQFSPRLLLTLPVYILDRKQHFTGLRWAAWRLVGVSRSTMNPNICSICEAHWDAGKVSEATVLFAGSPDFPVLMKEQDPEAVRSIVDEFLELCADIVAGHDGIVDYYMGQGVMAFFNVPIRRADHVDQAISAATEIQLAARRIVIGEGGDRKLRVGVSIDTGLAFTGNVGSGSCQDYSVLGGIVNVASRLHDHADAGGVLVTEAVYQAVGSAFPNAREVMLELTGVPEPVRAYSLS